MNDSGGPTRVSILGATGSIGSSTLRVLTHNPEQFAVVSLVAQRNVERLAEIALRTRAEFVAIADERQFAALKDHLSGSSIEVGAGGEAVIEAASRRADVVVSAITGYAGLRSTLAAARSGANLALANKEAMVTAGTMVARGFGPRAAVRSFRWIPSMRRFFNRFGGQDRDAITQLILTASGGPFRTWSKEDIQQAAPDQALKHPNWDMGAKVTIDSASMMNKGLELIEAQQIFDIAPDRLDVVVHPQSIVHSLVAYHDGGQLAQLGVPDMQTPISAALRWPKRTKTSVPTAGFGAITAV